MKLIRKSQLFFSSMADKFAPSATPFEGLVREKKNSSDLIKEVGKIIFMMGGGAFVGLIFAILTLLALVLLGPFLLFQILFFPIAAPITVFIMIGIVAVLYVE
jgi:hypothetical protein